MKVQLIAVDMDGTLLNPYGQITKRNADAIRRLKDYHVEFIICTGRDYMDVAEFLTSVNIQCGCICMSGAAVYNRNGSQLISYPLTDENIDDIRRIFDKYGVTMDILTANGRFSMAAPEEKLASIFHILSGGETLSGQEEEDLKACSAERVKEIHFIRSIKEAMAGGNTLYKIVAGDLPAKLVSRLKEEFSHIPALAAASSFPTNIELTNVCAQKGNALKFYSKQKGIPLEAVMTIGDSDNDLSMFGPEFGYTVAMGNAMECIKHAAKYHTKTNREDGVAWAIDRYITMH